MAHADQSNPLHAHRGSFGLLQRHGAGNGSVALQLDMFGAPPQRSCGHDLGTMRAELIEILGAGAAGREPPGDDVAQVRQAFLKAELARLDAA
jgi:hypothetical protein